LIGRRIFTKLSSVEKQKGEKRKPLESEGVETGGESPATGNFSTGNIIEEKRGRG